MSNATLHSLCNVATAAVAILVAAALWVAAAVLTTWAVASVRSEVTKLRRRRQEQYAEAMRASTEYQATHDRALRAYEESKQKKLTL